MQNQIQFQYVSGIRRVLDFHLGRGGFVCCRDIACCHSIALGRTPSRHGYCVRRLITIRSQLCYRVGNRGFASGCVINILRKIRESILPRYFFGQGDRAIRFSVTARKCYGHTLRTIIAGSLVSLQRRIIPVFADLDGNGVGLIDKLCAVGVIGCCGRQRAFSVISNGNGDRFLVGIVIDTFGFGAVGRNEFLNPVGVNPLFGFRLAGRGIHADVCCGICLYLGQVVNNRTESHRSARVGCFIHNGVGRVARVGKLEEEHTILQGLADKFLGGGNSHPAGSLVLVGEGELHMVAHAENHVAAILRHAVHCDDLDIARIVFLNGDGHFNGGAVIAHARVAA